MATIQDFIARQKKEKERKRKHTFLNTRPKYPHLKQDEFFEIFKITAENILIGRRKQDKEFEITPENKDVLQQLYFHMTNNSKLIDYENNKNKGVILLGLNGVGKTLILETYLSLYQMFNKEHSFFYIHAKQLFHTYKEKGIDYLVKKPILFIDDIGKEKIINDYGNQLNILEEVISLRYDRGAWTFATTNYNIEKLKEKYSQTIADRIKEMCFGRILKGQNYR